jgi:hypothetical protein
MRRTRMSHELRGAAPSVDRSASSPASRSTPFARAAGSSGATSSAFSPSTRISRRLGRSLATSGIPAAIASKILSGEVCRALIAGFERFGTTARSPAAR